MPPIARIGDICTHGATLITGSSTRIILQGELSIIMGVLEGSLMGAMASFEAHLTQQLSGLINNLSIAVAHGAAQAGLTGSGGGCNLPSNVGNATNDPCFNMSQLFGSLLNGGSNFLTPISNALNHLTGAINGITGAITSEISTIISTVMTTINGITSQISVTIAAEVAQLSNMINELLDFSNISTLFGLLNNNCAKNVLSNVATPSMASALGFN